MSIKKEIYFEPNNEYSLKLPLSASKIMRNNITSFEKSISRLVTICKKKINVKFLFSLTILLFLIHFLDDKGNCQLSKILSPYLFILFGKFAIIRIRRQSIYVLATMSLENHYHNIRCGFILRDSLKVKLFEK